MQKKPSSKTHLKSEERQEDDSSGGPQELEVLRSLRWVTTGDIVIFSVILFFFVMSITAVFARPYLSEKFLPLTDFSSMVVILLQITTLQLTLLIFRGSYFTLQVLVSTRTLPNIAARMAIPYMQDVPSVEEFDKNLIPSVASSWKFLREAGWFTRVDYVMALVSILALLLNITRVCTGHPAIVSILGLNIIWVVMLAYRQSYFVLQALADLKMLPVEASRLIVLFQRRV